MTSKDKNQLNLLVIEDNPADARLIELSLAESKKTVFNIQHIRTLAEFSGSALDTKFDLMLLDLTLPDATGLATVEIAKEYAPNLPFVVMSGLDHEELSIKSLQLGAQDYVIKSELNARSLPRLLIYALERHRLREKLDKLSRQQKYLATHDVLTGLPNRKLLYDRLKQVIATSEREGYRFALLFMDIDDFKKVNDTLGHSEGDLLLKTVAEKISMNVRSVDTIARIGGDEFVIILTKIPSPKIVGRIAKTLLNTICSSIALKTQEIFVSISIGIAIYPDDGFDVENLLKNADAAMYSAKDSGKNSFCFYTKSLNESAHKQLQMASDLNKALENDELFLQFQPQVDTQKKRLLGFEALVRWQHPEHGLIPPNEFIPLAEETGLIIPLGESIMRLACQQHDAWHDILGYPFRMAVNLSARQFEQANFVEMMISITNGSKVYPDNIDLELTESIIMREPEQTIAKLNQLKQHGFHLSIDDFGTGYSSLSYLKQLPIDTLKIDRSFVNDVVINIEDASIIKTIIALAKNLNINTIAEGVETTEQQNFLIEEGCHYMQGYLFSKPLSNIECIELLLVCQQQGLQLGPLA